MIGVRKNGSQRRPLGSKNVNVAVSRHDGNFGENGEKRRKLAIGSHSQYPNYIEAGSYDGLKPRQKKVAAFNDTNKKVGPNLPTSELDSDANVLILTRSKLKALQNSIDAMESQNFKCGHALCNMKSMDTSDSDRNWFLFDLEMSADDIINLRNSCYQKFIYRELNTQWAMANVLEQNPGPEAETFCLEQLHVNELDTKSQLATIPSADTSLKDIEVEMSSVIENESLYLKKKKTQKLPPSLLSKRNVKEIFDSAPMHADLILENSFESGFTSIANEQDPNETGIDETNQMAKKPKMCFLEKKLHGLKGIATNN